MKAFVALLAWILAMLLAGIGLPACARDGPIGIDHRVNLDDQGVWKRRNQLLLLDGSMLVVLSGALWLGDLPHGVSVGWKKSF